MKETQVLDLMFFQILVLYFTVLINGYMLGMLWIYTVFLSGKIPSFVSYYIWEDFTRLSCSYLTCGGFWIDLRIALKPKNNLPKWLQREDSSSSHHLAIVHGEQQFHLRKISLFPVTSTCICLWLRYISCRWANSLEFFFCRLSVGSQPEVCFICEWGLMNPC